ncbi:rhomboid family intramembrane serine protease [Streptomyces xanthochromogenes]|uniref:rhomboid family intramembrane serine protease n=1 Tax=Streptomyces xanthochromogenes TaxID=67384 RepID=UPI003436F993
MTLHTVILYGCAAAVVLPGVRIVQAEADGRRVSPAALLRVLWRRPVPWTAAAMVAVMTAMAVVQTAAPSVVDHLQREPGAPWWRAVTALLVQTSGWVQLAFNLAALLAIAPVAQRVLGPVRMPLVFLASGVAAQAVSMAGWSPTGGGDSVAVCGLIGALSISHARHPGPGPTRLLLIPAAGLVLCVLGNNHGVGVLAGFVLGAPLAGLSKPGAAQRVDAPPGVAQPKHRQKRSIS